jgi:hypothetical protein
MQHKIVRLLSDKRTRRPVELNVPVISSTNLQQRCEKQKQKQKQTAENRCIVLLQLHQIFSGPFSTNKSHTHI